MTNTPKLAYSIEAAAEAVGVSKSHLERALNSGQLRSKRTSVNSKGEPVGRRLILVRDLEAYLDALPDG